MPMVNGKKYPYTEEGKKKVKLLKDAKAKRDAARIADKKATPPKVNRGLKRPTGELPKRTSGYADYLQEKRPSISKSAAAAQAGRVRDAGWNVNAFKKKTTKPKKSMGK